MPKIIDNIDIFLHNELRDNLVDAQSADFCVGYFNLRGWRNINQEIGRLPGQDGVACRILVGMQKSPHDELRNEMRLLRRDETMDNQRAIQLRRRLAAEFREQITFGAPTNTDERALRHLSRQLREGRVKIKLHLSHQLHAKLYLLHRADRNFPRVGFVGSSNLTMAGLSQQGELNLDVKEQDSAQKLAAWFDKRWNDPWSLDISDVLAQIIDASWAADRLVPPWHIYLKIAWHLSEEAREGLGEYAIPADIDRELFEFQRAAVKIAAHHLEKRDGVLLGDVVGLGKTLMATAVARVFDQYRTLILCPKGLVSMWQDYVRRYDLRAEVMSTSRVLSQLNDRFPRHHLVIVDESHNMRNREGKIYRAIREYVAINDSKVMLLSATPFNKGFLDLSGQLRLFLPEDKEIGIRPEQLLRTIGEIEFVRRHQAGLRTLAAFEKSEFPDDWRELMRLFMVRRTRSFIMENYAKTDDSGRKYLEMHDGTPSYFPARVPRTVKFALNDASSSDQYAKLYDESIVRAINGLSLPRYGMGNHVREPLPRAVSADEVEILENLSRAGKRLMGFCRTNLYKRLESSGIAFLQSVERHILRNYIVLHAIETGQPIPLGTLDPEMLDTRESDSDELDLNPFEVEQGENGEQDEDEPAEIVAEFVVDEAEYRRRATLLYATYRRERLRRFKWLKTDLMREDLKTTLEQDSQTLLGILKHCGAWLPANDAKLNALENLLRARQGQKVLVFSQFADTVGYLTDELSKRGIQKLAGVTGGAGNPTALARRFSPRSNKIDDLITPVDELNVLIATDVLSEGQNLQDCATVVNFDLPWAIIRLIQRVGRIDRIGQSADQIQCLSFLPAEGVERIINLRRTLLSRLDANGEVVGTDEAFFESDPNRIASVLDIYNEKAGILDGEEDNEVDLASYAYQIWKNAVDADPSLARTIPAMQNVLFSAKAISATQSRVPFQPGVLTFVRTAQDNDALVWLAEDGSVVSNSQIAILEAARCEPDTPALPRSDLHHELVRKAVELIVEDEAQTGGQLGRPGGARYKTYMRLVAHQSAVRNTLFDSDELRQAIGDILRYPLRPLATDALNRRMREGIRDDELADLVTGLRREGRLCQIPEGEEDDREPQIVCSMGVIA